MKKMLVTGAQGFLGLRVALYYASSYEVLACGHERLDITNKQNVAGLLEEWRPDVVIHCAAISDTGYAEQHPEESEAVNLRGTIHVAEACRRMGCKLVYMSSDQVYNGNVECEPLSEAVAVRPENVYGRHKWQAEQEVARICPDAVGLRLTWMYDLPDSPYRQNRSLPMILTHASACGEQVKAAVREYRGITCVWDVVRRLEACSALPGGIYNFGSSNTKNSYETYLEAARLLQMAHPERWIQPDTERFPNHQRNLVMDLTRLRRYGLDFPDTLEGLRQALEI